MRTFQDTIPRVKAELRQQSENFKAGQIRFHLPQWQQLTIDRDVLKMVEGVDIDFTELPVQEKTPPSHQFSKEQTKAIDSEVTELLNKGVIKKTAHSKNEYVSPVFVRPKKDNKWRMILNLKQLNKNVEYHHFKMETLRNALALVTPNCFFCSLDLKDAYFSVHVNESSQEFLKFFWKGQLYTFTAFPNGLACCPRLFTKLLKPAMAHLHMLGFVSTIFIDDTLLIGESEEECVQNVKSSLSLFRSLGFVVHPEKSVLTPSRQITYLGFIINSENMTVVATDEKKQKIMKTATKLLTEGSSTVRELAQFIGQVVACFAGVKFGPLWYRSMERDKTRALKQNKGNFDSRVNFSEETRSEMRWWKKNIAASYNHIDIDNSNPDLILFTDASLTGWGCSCELGRTGGQWNHAEAQSSINVLELKAALLSLQSFVREKFNIHVRLMMDNTTAVACVSKMGTSHSDQCNTVTKEIWQFCIQRDIWVSAAYVPGKENVEADEESRKENQDTEWMLNSDILSDSLKLLGAKPEIDLFASRLNKQLPSYVSYKPDPTATAVNAFTLSWACKVVYCFPPFCVIPRVLQKISKDKARGILVVPDWPSQPWYSKLARMITQPPILVSARENLLIMPANPAVKHRLRRTLRMIICAVSGNDSDARDFRRQLPQSFAHRGGVAQADSMPLTLQDGRGMRANEAFIPFRRL